MRWIPDRYRELRTRLRPERIEDDVDEELALHLELREADLAAAGLDPAAARAEALRRFGSVSDYRAETCAIERSVLRERRRMELMDAIRRETRLAGRSLQRAPLFAAVAIVTLGLGIGATTAIFTLLDSIVLRPLAYPAPERLVQLTHAVPLVQEGQEWGNSVASYFHYGDNNSAFEELAAARRTTFSVSGDGDAERLNGAQASASLFRVLGARAAHGRLIGDEDDAPGRDPVVVLSNEIWRTRYNADPAIVGRTIQLNARPVTVIGVLEPGFALPEHDTHFWLPLQLDRTAQPVNSHMQFVTYGRLRPGVTHAAAEADLLRLMGQMPELFPTAYSERFYEGTGFSPRVHPLRSVVLGRTTGGRIGIDDVLWMLLGAVSLVLLIACANVGNLMLVRAEARRRELTVRAALGAERAHMAVHYLTESMLIAGAAAVLGLALAFGGIRLLIATAPPTLPRLGDIAITSHGVLFAIGVSVLTALVFGLTPVLRRAADFGELRESGRGMTPSRDRQLVRNALVVGQVGMALVLLAAGGLMLRSFLNLRTVPWGGDAGPVLTFDVTLPSARYGEEQDIFRFQQEFVRRVGALGGVRHVSATTALPFRGEEGCSHTVAEVATNGGCVPTIFVLPDYFAALDIDVQGEAFTWADLERREPVAVISQALARRLLPSGDVIGGRIISYQDGPPWFRIIGIAEDVLANGLDKPAIEAVYYPTRRPAQEGYFGPHGMRTLTFVVSTALAEPASLTPAVRGILRELDPEVPLALASPMTDVIMSSEKMARTTFTMMLLGIAAVIALFLSAVGLYGVIAYLVGRRRAEIGVRMALGARVSEVARLVVMQSVRLTVAGIVIGLAGAVLVTRALASLVWGVQPTDPATLVGVSVLLLFVAVLASLLPARRAARTPPTEALRAD